MVTDNFKRKTIATGVLGILLACFVMQFTWRDRNIRLTGQVVKAPIAEFSKSSVSVEVHGEVLNAGRFNRKGYSIGDSIEVCYIPNEYCVVQKRVKPNIYYLYFGLEAIPFLVGIYLIIGGILADGKAKESECVPVVTRPKRNKKKTVKKFK